MEKESAHDSGEAGGGAPIIFMCDASAEAERLTLTLRTHGYVVTDVPLSLLTGRVGVQRPSLVLCDADADGALETVARIREGESGAAIAVILLGDRNGAIARLDGNLVAAVFARPVNVPELVSTVVRLVGGADGAQPATGRGARPSGASSRPPGRASNMPLARSAERGPRPELAQLPLPPDLGAEPAAREAADAPVVELSQDIHRMLVDAQERLEAGQPAPPPAREELGPEVDAEAQLPPDVLLALEEPLDEEDLGEEEGRTPEPSLDGTSPRTGMTAAKGPLRQRTQIGGTSTGLGTDSTGIPDSVDSSHDVRGGTALGVAPHLTQNIVQGTLADRHTGAGTSVDRAEKADSEKGESDKANEKAGASAADEEGAGEDDARRARQQASTPKPPKPTPEDEAGASLEPPPIRATAPPPTVLHPLGPPSDEAPSSASVSSGRRGSLTQPPVLTREDVTPLPVRVRAPSGAPPSPEISERLGSTTPPLRPRDEGPASFERSDSERPSTPHATSAARETDRPSPSHPENERPLPPSSQRPSIPVPSTLRAGDALHVLARAIGSRYTGSVAFEVDEGIRRVVLRDGDFVTVASGVHGESLVAFLAGRGDLPAEVARQGHKLPAFGRRAGAALIAHGHLAQDQLWPVLRAHAEWLVGRVLRIERGNASLEETGRLSDEPAVFGGATGAEVLLEVTRRIVPPEEAVERIGGDGAVLSAGPSRALLAECALSATETDRIQLAEGTSLRELLEGSLDPGLASAVYALLALGVLKVEAPRPKASAMGGTQAPKVHDEIDDEAIRARILSRKALVDEGDYFAVLGVPREATGYDIRRAYATLRREFEPSRLLTARTADLGDVVTEILGVLEEAYQILSDQRRRDRYLRAIEAAP